MLGMVRNC